MVFTVCAFLLAAAASSQKEGASSFGSRVDATIRSLPEQFHGVVLITRGGEPLFVSSYGLADLSHRVANRPETRFLIGSVTKQFTAVLTLRLAQLGLVELDAPILQYIPEYPRPNGEKITVRHLLSHRSGIPHHSQGIPRYFDYIDRLSYTPREYMALFWNLPMLHEPGARFTYSSPGYTLLGFILESATGRSYAELLREHILMPLALKHTSVNDNLTVLPDTATGYRNGPNGLLLARREEESTRGAAGSILTTAGDLARFQSILSRTGDGILNAESKAMLLEKHSTNYSFAGALMAVPFFQGNEVLNIVTHGGSSYGFMARADRLVELDTSIIALSNVQDADLGRLFDRVGDVVLEELNVRPRPAAPPAR